MDAARLDRLASALQRIFDQDPHFNWLIRQDARRAEALRRLFRLLLGNIPAARGELWVRGENDALLIGFPPGTGRLPLRRQWAFLRAYLPVSGWKDLARRVWGIQKMAWHRPHEPHYYVQVIGVDPAHQGTGLGRALLSQLVSRCDGCGWPLYLETANPRNLGFYEKLGFALNRRYGLPGGLELFGLWRKAAGQGGVMEAAR